MCAISSSDEPNSGFKPEFFDDLFYLESRNFWFRARNRLIIWAITAYFKNCQSFLEIGCGTGFVLTGLTRELPSWDFTGSELYPEGLSYARRRLPVEVELLQLDARFLPFTEKFDVIGAFDVLEHIYEDEIVLEELWKACRTGIILTVPQHKWLWSGVDDYSCHYRRYERDELLRKLEKAGFEVIRITSFVSVLLPLLAMSRFMKKNSGESESSKAELSLPVVVDCILELCLGLERLALQAGMNFPLGGSLLVVANKSVLGRRSL